MKFDGFDMSLNGSDRLSVYQEDEKNFQISITVDTNKGEENFFYLLSRDELVELKSKLDLLLTYTE